MRSVFISHNVAADGAAAQRLRSDLLAELPGAFVHVSSEHDAGPLVGTSWQSWIGRTIKNCDVVVFIVSRGSLSPWCSAELGMARLLRKPIVPLHRGSTEHVNPLVGDLQAAPLDQPIAEIVRLIEARVGSSPEMVAVGADYVPYPGLVPLADGMPLFGRTEERDRVLGDLLALEARDPSILVISGPSGSGKSSLLRAGLLRPLREAGWQVVGPAQPKQLLTDGFPAVPDASRRMMIIDQAEELFDLDRTDREAVERRLRQVVADGIALVVLVRIEFRNEIGAAFAGADQAGDELPKPIDHYIPYLDAHGLREIVRGPARLANLDVSDTLVGKLVEQTGTGEALPLLAYTLHLLWEDRDREHEALRESTLDALGGVDGVLVTQAQLALRRATSGDPTLNEPVLAVLSRLASPTHQPPTRAPEPIQGLTDRERGWLDEFRKVGLVSYRRTYDIDDTIEAGTQPTGDDLVDVTHEALFGWPPLRAAIDEHRSANTMLDDIRRLAARWRDGADQDPMLLSGDNLRFALRRGLAGSDDPTMRKFVRVSRRRDRGRRLTVAFLAAVVVLAALAATQWLRAARERDRAERAETVAESVRVATQANRAIESERDLAMLAAVAAHRIDDNDDTRGALFNVLATPTGPLRYFADNSADWSTLRMIDQERGIVVTSSRRPAIVDLANRDLDVVELADPAIELTGVEPAHDERFVFRGRLPPSTWSVGISSLGSGTDAHAAHPVEVTAVAPHPDGVVFGDVEGGVYFAQADGVALGEPVLIDRHRAAITDLDTTVDGRWVASATQRGVRIQQRSAASWAGAADLLEVTAGARAAENVVFRRDGPNDLFAAGGDPTIRRWSLRDGTYVERESPGSHRGVVEALTVDPDEPILYSAGVDGGLQRWNSEIGAPVGDVLSAHRADVIALSTAGESLLVSTDAERAILWDLADERIVERRGVIDTSWANERVIALVNGDGPLAALTVDDRVLIDGRETLTAPPGGRKAWWVAGGVLIVETGDREQIHRSPLSIWRIAGGTTVELGSDLDAAAVGRCTVALAAAEVVRFVDAGACGDPPEPIALDGGKVSELALSADEERLLVVFDDNRVEQYRLGDGSALRSVEPPHGIDATGATWLDDDNVIIGYDRGAQVRLVDPAGASLALAGHSDAVWWLAVDRAGERLFTAGHDGLIVHTALDGPVQIGEPLVGVASRRLNDNAAAVRGLRLVADDEVLVGIHGFRLVAWELDIEELVQRACFEVDRAATPDEMASLGIADHDGPCQ